MAPWPPTMINKSPRREMRVFLFPRITGFRVFDKTEEMQDMGFLLLCTIGVTETTAKAPLWVTLFSVIFTVDLTASLILESSSSLSNLKK